MNEFNKTIESEICSWLGKRWIHGQSAKSTGADCIQFIVAIAKFAGWLPQNYQTIRYAKDWAVHNDKSVLKDELEKVANQIMKKEDRVLNNLDKLQLGDVIVIVSGKTAGHAGIYLKDGRIVHSHIVRGIVKESLSIYEDLLDSVWRFKQCH